MQELNFELYKLIKRHDSSDQVLECLMIANDSFITKNWVILNSDDEILQKPIEFKFIKNEDSYNKKIFLKQGYSCLMAKFNEGGIIVKKTSKEKIDPGTNSFGILKSVILNLDNFKFNEINEKINHLKGVKLILAEDSFEWLDDTLIFNRFSGNIISFEIIFASYEDLQNEIIRLKNDKGQLIWREVKRQLDKENTFLYKIGIFLGIRE